VCRNTDSNNFQSAVSPETLYVCGSGAGEHGESLGYETPARRHPYLPLTPSPNTPKANTTISQTPSSVVERRLAIARRLYSALVAQQPDRVFTLRDGRGRVERVAAAE